MDLARWLAAPDGQKKNLYRSVRRHAGLCRPTDHAAQERLNDDAEIQPGFTPPQIGDVGRPDLAGKPRASAQRKWEQSPLVN